LKYILAIVVVLIIGTLIFIFSPDKTFEAGKREVISEAVQEKTITIEEPPSTEDERYAAMQMEFEKLDKARRNLDRKLARLKAILWDVKLPVDQAAEIKKEMQNGYALLKNKKMLGAYFELSQIVTENEQVNFVYSNLDVIEKRMRKLKKQER